MEVMDEFREMAEPKGVGVMQQELQRVRKESGLSPGEKVPFSAGSGRTRGKVTMISPPPVLFCKSK